MISTNYAWGIPQHAQALHNKRDGLLDNPANSHLIQITGYHFENKSCLYSDQNIGTKIGTNHKIIWAWPTN